tara:strand:+ start:2713 stop:4494 length:1782 start_codon:yes stop_codon:yes gene_type:complete
MSIPELFISTKKNEYGKERIYINKKNYNWPILEEINHKFHIFIIGHPIIKNKINPSEIIKYIKKNNYLDIDYISEIDGEFLIVYFDIINETVHLINDRFASIPIYYFVKDNDIFISQFYYHLAKKIKKLGTFKINKTAIIQFLTLQRLFGDITYDTLSKYLPASSYLQFKNNKLSIIQYWNPTFEKNNNSLQENAIKLSNLLRESIRIKTSNIKKPPNLFLSGGLDSRLIFSAFDKNIKCTTFSEKKNNETKIAYQVANVKNSNIKHIKTGKDPFSKYLDDIIKLNGGMYVFDHSIFYTLRHNLGINNSVFFHGHGLDFMLQGKYLPQNSSKIFNYNLSKKTLKKIKGDFTNYFINNIPYRLKKINFFKLIEQNQQKNLFNILYKSIDDVYKKSLPFSNNNHDSWNFMTTQNLSRHFSHANLISMATLGEVRSVVYYNKIFDFYHAIPDEQKLNGNLFRKTQKILSTELSKIKSANDNIPINLPPILKDMYRVWHRFLYVIKFNKQKSLWPSSKDRTHPNRDQIFFDSDKMMQKAIDLKKSKFLIELKLIDMNLLSNFIDQWINSPSKGGGALINFLITLNEFFHQLSFDNDK